MGENLREKVYAQEGLHTYPGAHNTVILACMTRMFIERIFLKEYVAISILP